MQFYNEIRLWTFYYYFQWLQHNIIFTLNGWKSFSCSNKSRVFLGQKSGCPTLSLTSVVCYYCFIVPSWQNIWIIRYCQFNVIVVPSSTCYSVLVNRHAIHIFHQKPVTNRSNMSHNILCNDFQRFNLTIVM